MGKKDVKRPMGLPGPGGDEGAGEPAAEASPAGSVGLSSLELPLTVKEVCRLTGVTARQLQHYDDIGLLCPARSGEGVANNRKLYGVEDIERLKRILVLQEYGLGLKEVGDVLAGGEGKLLEALEGRLRALRREENRLKNLIVFARFAQVVDDDDVCEALVNGAYEIDDFAEPMMLTPAYEVTCEAARARSEEEWDAMWDEFVAIVGDYVLPEGNTAFCDHERTVERLCAWWGRYNAPLDDRGLLGLWLMLTEDVTAPAIAEVVGGDETPGFLQADLFFVWAKRTLKELVGPVERLVEAEVEGDEGAVEERERMLLGLFCRATGADEIAKVVDEEDLSPFLVDLCEGLLGYLDGLLDSPELMAYVDPEGEVALSREALSRAEGAITRAARRMAAPKGEELPRS